MGDTQKTEVRTRIRELLDTMDEKDRHERSAAACGRLLGLEPFRHAHTVMLYMPLATEVDVTPVALRCFQLGKRVCVPEVNWERREMRAVEVTSFDDHVMETGRHGIRTPRETRPIPSEMIGMIIVPAMAYDPNGRRLGRGGGYYDRYLPRLPRSTTKVGIVFDVQMVDEVPAVEHDVPVDIVVTDRRVSRAGAFPRAT